MQMYGSFEGSPVIIIVPSLGWNDPCFWGREAIVCMRGWYESVQGTMVRSGKPSESMLGIGSE